MLEYVKARAGARLSAAVLHEDDKREYAYGPAQGLPDMLVEPGHQHDEGAPASELSARRCTPWPEAGLDGRQHEERLEAHLRLRGLSG
jgi:hypothetical protein